MNDPNGLVKYKDTWFLFYQWNPDDTVPGNTHWGKATSRDLLHWEHHAPAICPDDTDGMIFSGSAIVDERNVSGLKQGEDDPILLFYTGTGYRTEPPRIPGPNGFPVFDPAWDRPATRQCIAYSVDGGVTFQKYAGNPILPEYAPLNRDPKVNYVPECDAYVMALYVQKNEYRLFWSDDLLHWSEGQSITMTNSAECPDIFSLPLNGCPRSRKWIFFAAPDNYLIGRMEGRVFVPESDLIRGNLTSRLRTRATALPVYAAQTYFAPHEDRVIQFSWMPTYFPGAPFRGQMSLPWELELVTTPVGPRLRRKFAREVESLRRENGIICASDSVPQLNAILVGRRPFGKIPQSKAAEILVETWLHEDTRIGISVFGVSVIYDHVLHRLLLPIGEFPLPPMDRLDLHIIADRGGLELFCCGGKFNSAWNTYLDPTRPPLEMLTLEHCSVNVELYELTL